MEDARGQYQHRAEQFAAEADRLRRTFNRLAWARLALFLVVLSGGLWLWRVQPLAAAAGFLAGAAVFAWLVLRHRRLVAREAHCRLLVRINEEEIRALSHQFDQFPDGASFLDRDHPYAVDLDIFGPFSLFQYLNRCTLPQGENRLAAWLGGPAPEKVITERQEAVQELSGKLHWRQDFRARGLAIRGEANDLDLLQSWLDEPPIVAGQPWLVRTLYVLPWITAGALAYAAWNYPWYVAVACLLPSGYLIRRFLRQVTAIHEKTSRAAARLTGYASLIAAIEAADFSAPALRKNQEALQTGGDPPSKALRQLAFLIHQLDVRYNVFAIFLNLIGLWDLQWVLRLERWKARWRETLPHWFDALAELEALSSLANLHFNQADWTFPVIEPDANIVATALGHPLIPSGKRVGNDLEMPARGHLKLITGSNMAGKSTWLRTVGLNLVLAQAGAPACARALRTPPLQVFSSMRTQDALSENTSSFFAELRRLHDLILAAESAKDPAPGVFFLLDEVLKGTNSRDRHKGAEALIRQLLRLDGAGLLATHDLELARLEAESAGQIENWCMEVEIQGDDLHFDYKIKRGVSHSFSATQLMRRMGIEVGEG